MINFSKIKNLKKKEEVNTSFIQGMPSLYIEPYVDEKEDGKRNKIYFNDEAMNLMGLYQEKEGKVVDKVLFVKDYAYSENRVVPVITVTTEQTITDDKGKVYHTNKFSKSTKTVVSKPMYEDLVSFYSLDKNQHHTFVLERSSVDGEEDVFFIHLHDFKLNKGEDVAISTVEENIED